MATPLLSPKVVGDLILIEDVDQNITRRQAVFTNDTGAIASFKIGQTLLVTGDSNTGFVAVIAPTGAASGVLLKNLFNVAIAGTALVPVLKNGPCSIDRDQLVYASTVDATEAAAQRVALEALGIRCVREPLKQGAAADVLT
jgi:hypothetical protein